MHGKRINSRCVERANKSNEIGNNGRNAGGKSAKKNRRAHGIAQHTNIYAQVTQYLCGVNYKKNKVELNMTRQTGIFANIHNVTVR